MSPSSADDVELKNHAKTTGGGVQKSTHMAAMSGRTKLRQLSGTAQMHSARRESVSVDARATLCALLARTQAIRAASLCRARKRTPETRRKGSTSTQRCHPRQPRATSPASVPRVRRTHRRHHHHHHLTPYRRRHPSATTASRAPRTPCESARTTGSSDGSFRRRKRPSIIVSGP